MATVAKYWLRRSHPYPTIYTQTSPYRTMCGIINTLRKKTKQMSPDSACNLLNMYVCYVIDIIMKKFDGDPRFECEKTGIKVEDINIAELRIKLLNGCIEKKHKKFAIDFIHRINKLIQKIDGKKMCSHCSRHM